MADNKAIVEGNAAAGGSSAAKAEISKNDRLDFELHVALIQRMDAVPKSKAVMRAWLEGRAGLNVRLQK